MDEKVFQAEIKRSIKFFRPECFYHKIADPQNNFDFVAKLPFDSFYVSSNRFTAFEYKIVKDAESFNFARVEDHQIYHLLEISQIFCGAFLLINYRFSFTDSQMKKYEATESKQNFIFCADILDFMQLKNLYNNFLQRQSIPFSYIWDLRKSKAESIIEWEKFGEEHYWNIEKLL